MTPPDRAPGFAIERLIMALDVTAPDLGAIATTARIAARLGTVIDAVLLEDSNLARLAALPVARQVSRAPPAAPTRVDPAQLDAELRAMTRRIEQALAAAAHELGLAWSLRSIRGQLPAALTGALGLHDLLVVSAAQRAQGGPAGLPLPDMARRTERSVLLLSNHAVPRHPTVVLRGQSSLAARALAAGSRLRPRDARALDIVLSSREADAAEAAATIRRQLNAEGVAARLARVAGESAGDIAAALNATGSDLAVVAGDLTCIALDGAEDLMSRTQHPVMIVR
jgi:hypothetical protein